MNGLAKKVIVYSLIGCLQFGVGATAVEAASRHDDNRQRQEQRMHEQRERERRQHEEERRIQEQRERERRQHEERERERRHQEEMRRHHHEDRDDDDNTLRDVGLGLILLTILANSGGDDSGD
jgi:TolA-binding protein